MRRLMTISAMALMAGLLSFALAAEEKGEFDMHDKLTHSQQILDGLVTEDFSKIQKGAKALNDIGRRKWTESESPEYRTQNQVFWFTAASLSTAAEQKNIDGATLAYTQLTLSCVNCHKIVRSQ